MSACNASCGWCGRCTAEWDDTERDDDDERTKDERDAAEKQAEIDRTNAEQFFDRR